MREEYGSLKGARNESEVEKCNTEMCDKSFPIAALIDNWER